MSCAALFQREWCAAAGGAARKAALKPPKAAEGPAAQRCLPSSLAAAQGCLAASAGLLGCQRRAAP